MVWAQGAATSQTLSVSPTLFDMKASAGQSWESEIRVVNVNNYDLLVYPQVVNFAPLDESGRGNLIPVFAAETKGTTLAEWVIVSSEPIIVPKQQTVAVPIKVQVPADAAPGGHYAAILIGTKPPTDSDRTSQVQTAQFVTSLLFVRVAGDVVEAGTIREFTTAQSIAQSPKIGLGIRFENKGNVHLQPQGEIMISNMWGSQRGIIPINHQTHFGNVLPNSIREFLFTWEGDTSVFDIGRYTAVATLGYGEEDKQFVTATTYFWIVPYTIILSSLVAIMMTVWLITWFVRRYIERMLSLERTFLKTPYVPQYQKQQLPGTIVVGRYAQLTSPVRSSLQDLSSKLRVAQTLRVKITTLAKFIVQYRLFFSACLFVIAIIWGTMIIINQVAREDTNYAITIGNPDTALTLTAEDVAYQAAHITAPTPAGEIAQAFTITIVNSSGVNGTAALTRLSLEAVGYEVASMTTDSSRTDVKSVIVYDPNLQIEALAISTVLGGVLLSATDELSERGAITIYAGKDIAHRAAQ